MTSSADSGTVTGGSQLAAAPAASRSCAHCGAPLNRRQRRFCSPACTARHCTPPPRPFPIEALLEVAGVSLGQLGRLVAANGLIVAMAAVHGLTVSEADRWAVRLGYHPSFVWPEWFDIALEGAA